MLIRLLIPLALLIAVFWLLRRFSAKNQTAVDVGQARPAEPLLRCQRCDVHVTPANAVRNAAGQVFCSEAHRDQQPES